MHNAPCGGTQGAACAFSLPWHDEREMSLCALVHFTGRTHMTRTAMARTAAALLIAMPLPLAHARAPTDSASARNRAGAYDASQSVALTGVTVVRVDTPKQGGAMSLSALLAAGNDSVTAALAPVEFLNSKSFTLAAGNVIDITFSKGMAAGRPVLIASEIRKGGTKVTLRDKATGTPACRNRCRRAPDRPMAAGRPRQSRISDVQDAGRGARATMLTRRPEPPPFALRTEAAGNTLRGSWGL